MFSYVRHKFDVSLFAKHCCSVETRLHLFAGRNPLAPGPKPKSRHCSNHNHFGSCIQCRDSHKAMLGSSSVAARSKCFCYKLGTFQILPSCGIWCFISYAGLILIPRVNENKSRISFSFRNIVFQFLSVSCL